MAARKKKAVKLDMTKVRLFHKREEGAYTIRLGGRFIEGVRLPMDTPPVALIDGEFEGEVPEVAITYLMALKDVIVKAG